jgi:protein tyrosine phosphatase (PTP) superfamily phosphohydrolase (DUF442 family)
MPWEVRATKPGFSTTYLCASAQVALQSVRHFARKDYRTLVVTAPDGEELTRAELEALVAPATADATDARAEPLQV